MNTPTAPHEFRGRIRTKQQLTELVYYFNIELVFPKTITFSPGQFLQVEIDEKTRRCYSIASSNGRTNELDLLIDIGPGGMGSAYFKKKRVGDELHFRAPMGKFGLVSESGPMVFLATGTGIAPLKSMIDHLVEKQQRTQDFSERTLYVHLGFRYEKDVFWDQYFKRLEQTYPNIHFELTLSQPSSDWTGSTGYVQTHIPEDVSKNSETQYYVCGSSRMVQGVVQHLRELAIDEQRIHFEPF